MSCSSRRLHREHPSYSASQGRPIITHCKQGMVRISRQCNRLTRSISAKLRSSYGRLGGLSKSASVPWSSKLVSSTHSIAMLSAELHWVSGVSVIALRSEKLGLCIVVEVDGSLGGFLGVLGQT